VNIGTLSVTINDSKVVIRDVSTDQVVAMSMGTAAELLHLLRDLLSMPAPRQSVDNRPADWRRRW
jgi:hypothetical protein